MIMHVWMLPKIEFLSLSDVNEKRAVALVSGNPAWTAVRDKLRLNVVWQFEPREASEEHWLKYGAGLQGEVIYAVGGGLAVDAAKYLAVQHELPLICVPTALSVDAFLTWASGVRRDGCVYYVETKPPDQLLVDFDVIAAGPASIRAAGICDVLSIATGVWDWRFAHERGQLTAQTAYVPYADQIAQGILRGALDCAAAAGQGDHEGLKQLLDCLALEVQLCNQLGHSRPEEGSEHYFAYSVENVMGKGLPHGDLVGPGILVLAALQGQNIGELKRSLQDCCIPLNNIPPAVIEQTVRNLPEYVRRHHLPYGLAHELTADHVKHIPVLTM